MASLFGSAITAFCIGAAPAAYNDACSHAVDAGTRQVGWRQQIDYAEDRTTQVVNGKVMYRVEKIVGREGVSIIAVGGYVYKVVKEKSIGFRLPTLGLCNSISNQITLESYKLVLEWKW